jgi:WD40 repeat protein
VFRLQVPEQPMAEQEQSANGDVLNMEWDGEEAAELDAEFRAAGETVELDIDSGDEPVDSDGEDVDQEIGDGDIYEDDEDDEFAGIDHSLASVVEHKEAVLSVGISPVDKQLFVTGGQDDVAILWALEEVRFVGGLKCVERARLLGHTDSVNTVSFSNDGQYVATGSYDATVKIWTAATGALLHTLEGPAKEVEWVLWHPKGHAILAGSADTMAWMWWAPTGKLMQIFAGHAQGVTTGCWAMGGKLICTGSEDRSVIVWNPRAGTPQQHIKALHESNIITICSHPDSPILVTGSEDSQGKVVHIETGRVISTICGHQESVEHVAFNNYQAGTAGSMLLLATASMDGRVQIFDGKTFDTRCVLTDHVEKGGVTVFKWLPATASGFLCTASLDRTCRLFNALLGQCVHTFRGHTDTVLGLDLMLVDAPDGTANAQVCVVSASDDKTCKIFVQPLQAGAEASAAAGASVAPTDASARTLSGGGYSSGAPPAVASAQDAAAAANPV